MVKLEKDEREFLLGRANNLRRHLLLIIELVEGNIYIFEIFFKLLEKYFYALAENIHF